MDINSQEHIKAIAPADIWKLLSQKLDSLAMRSLFHTKVSKMKS